MKSINLIIVCLFCQLAYGQTNLPESYWQKNFWTAKWVVHPTAGSKSYGIYHFRKTVDLPQKPERFIVHVTADNRYQLFVNGISVALGPARSDLQNWYYETVDLAPYLKTGSNTIAARVWNMGEGMPYAQISYQTGFVIQGDTEVEKIVNTDDSWRVFQNPAYSPIKNDVAKFRRYIVVGDGDRVDGRLYPWGWQQPGFDDQSWSKASPLRFKPKPRGMGSDGNWQLVPRTIPMMDDLLQRLGSVRRVGNVTMTADFLQGKAPVTVPGNTKAVFLLDQGFLTNAYPELTVSRGKEAVITLSYAEALMDDKRQKGNRNEIDGRQLFGFDDQFIGDGNQKHTFRPLWFRTYRYLQLTVETQAEPVVLEDFIGRYTGYPFEEKATFASNDTTLRAIWNVGWRTAKLCAGENYYDCPYYEQLQYVGDTRVQSLISLYVTGDDRLMRKAITDFYHSRFTDGLTQSRYPSADFQAIPPFSLFWVCMIHDYWMHRQDDTFIKQLLPGIESVLAWHEQRLAPNGLNGPLEWWNFVDWAKWNNTPEETIGGVPSGARYGGSSILTLQQVYALSRAADLFDHYGLKDKAAHYRALAGLMKKAVLDHCWDATKGVLADTPAKISFSQHANILAVLTDAVPPVQQALLLKKNNDRFIVDSGHVLL
jgi:alpha-L-rhamnosidase